MFVDIHTHHKTQSDFPTVRSLNPDETASSLSVFPESLFSVGLHPWFITEKADNELKNLRNFLSDRRIVFIGECGLDKNSKVSHEKQTEVFRQQILLSEEFCKPLIIHCVGCFNELFAIRKVCNPSQRWIIHGFRGKPELAAQALKSGCDLSFGEYFNEEALRLTPFDRLFIETDESALSIDNIYQKIAKAKTCEPESLKAGCNLLHQISALT